MNSISFERQILDLYTDMGINIILLGMGMLLSFEVG